MREILFRGKRVDNGEWVYGYLSKDTICSITDTYLALVIHRKPQSVFDSMWYEVIPETVGQYTGLKDKNDKKIFTGDILTDAWGKKLTVYFDSCYLQIRAKEIGSSLTNSISYYVNISKLKVIGNIHYNPELLEVKK